MIRLIKNLFKRKQKQIKVKNKNYTNDEFYCIIKLVSGEEIFSFVMTDENNGNPIVILHNPVIMKIILNQKGMFIKAKSWIEMSNDDMFVIHMDKIITMTEIKDEKIISVYKNYVYGNDENLVDNEEVYNNSGRVKPSSNMGYISSVTEARKKLEEIYKSL